MQRSVAAVLVQDLADNSGAALAGDAEYSQGSGRLRLHSFNALLDHAVQRYLLAELELINVCGQALVYHLKQTVQLFGARLQNLKSLVSVGRVAHGLASVVHQASQKRFINSTGCGFGLDFSEGHHLSLNAKRVGDPGDHTSGVLSLVHRQVKRLVWRPAWLTD